MIVGVKAPVLQVYKASPGIIGANNKLSGAQNVVSSPRFILGAGAKVTSTVSAPVQPATVTLSQYVPVPVGLMAGVALPVLHR